MWSRSGITLAAADAWLSGLVGGVRQGLAGRLEETSPEIVVRELLIKDTFLGAAVSSEQEGGGEVLQAYLERQLGLSKQWIDFVAKGAGGQAPRERLKHALESWTLCVEYANDLQRAPHVEELRPLKKLAKQYVELCREQARALRNEQSKLYGQIAERVQDFLGFERQAVLPDELGRVDTFRFEEMAMLSAAIEALEQGQWHKVCTWADDRCGEVPFWLRQDPQRRTTWRLVQGAAVLGARLHDAPRPFEKVRDLEQAVFCYVETAHAADRAHRHFEQLFRQRLDAQLPDFVRLKRVAGELRRRYRDWADRLARDFSQVCRAEGVLPEARLQQRTLFEQVVVPLIEGGARTAIFVIDALRFEMATELVEMLDDGGTKCGLEARFAELPTITAVGMNALAPVARGGRLIFAGKKGFAGFSDGEYAVNDPDSRARAMGLRSTGVKALALGLDELCALDPKTLKRKVAQKKLIMVQDREIDEAGVGLATFENTLSRIKSAWHQLRAAGVQQCVITADHGFLLADETIRARPYGKRTDPDRRFVAAEEQRAEEGLLAVPFEDLGYGERQGYLLVAEDTALFDTEALPAPFVHGGNCPQERIIPVLQVTSKFAPAEDLTVYRVKAERDASIMGWQRIRLRLVIDQQQTAGLAYLPSEAIDLTLSVPGIGDRGWG